MTNYLLSSTRIKKEEPQDTFYDAFSSPHMLSAIQMHGDSKAPPTPQSPSTTVSYGSIEQALLKPSIFEKCKALTAAFSDNINIKNLQHQYPIIIQKIFGFGQYPPGWHLEITHRIKSKRDSDALLAFLHPNGPLFTNVIYKLMAEEVAFEFPYNFLPEATVRKLEEGLPISELYSGKFTSTQQLQPMLVLDPFEFYFFIFAHKMTSSSTKGQDLYLEPSEWVYPTLLDDYLHYFLPQTGMPSPAPHIPVSSKPSQPPLHTPRSSAPQSRRQGLGLLKQAPPQFSRSLSVQQLASESIIDSDVMWRSERVVQVLTEFWMCQKSLDLPSHMSSTRLTNPPNDILPSHDRIMLVRMFIKHIHSFANTFDNNVLPSHHQNPHTILGALKKSLVPRYIQKPLYGFLKLAIEKWPLDTSFRPILETWLTFIQPWRYAFSAKPIDTLKASGSGDDGGEDMSVDFLRLWEGFVKLNSLFYSVLFQDVLSRFLRIDLTSSKMSYQLFRVCKVFSVGDLAATLRNVDISAISGSSTFQDYQGAGYQGYSDVTEGVVGAGQLMLITQITSIESASFSYRPLFCEEVAQQVYCLLQEMSNAQQSVRKLKKVLESKQTSSQDNSLLSLIGLGKISEYNDAQLSSENQSYASTDKWLEQSMNILADVFRLQIPECDLSTSSDAITYSSSDTQPDHFVKPDGSVELTALGRYQVLNGLRKFTNIEYRCDPELQPVRTFESKFGVIQLYKLACAINKKYGAWFAEHYDNDGLIGHIARRLLSMPPETKDSRRYAQPRLPRLSLRFLANYYFLGYSVVGYLVMSTMFGRFPTVALAMLVFVLYVLIAAARDTLRASH